MSVLTQQQQPPSLPTTPTTTTTTTTTACPSCGTHVPIAFPAASVASLSPTETQARIIELESQVGLLNGKAAAAADKLADYEDEVRFLRAVHARKEQQEKNGGGSRDTSSNSRPGSPPDNSNANGSERPHPQTSRLSSFSAFLPGRRGGSTSVTVPPSPGFPPPNPTYPSSANTPSTASMPNLLPSQSQPQPPPQPDPSPSIASTLRLEIANEKRLRLAAESSLSSAHHELEELTAQLFSQANEMVATERRARAKLEERVAVLEKRDFEKRRRLERLEKAVERIDRVKGMVGA
jgi:GDP/GTP exchange factor Sec2p